MNIKSEQKFEEVQVTDLDIAFPGDLQTFTLRKGVDSYTTNAGSGDSLNFVNGDRITINMNGGVLHFNLRQANWFAIRRRTIRVPVPEPARAE